MPASRKTLDQKRSSRLYSSFSDQSSRIDPSAIERSYQESADRLWKLGETWEERLAYYLFGKDLMASWAFALDPLKDFRSGLSQTAYPSRTRDRYFGPPLPYFLSTEVKHTRNYIADYPFPVPEYQVEDSPDFTGDVPWFRPGYEYMLDSVKSQRGPDENYGRMSHMRQKASSTLFPVVNYVDEGLVYLSGGVPNTFFDRYTTKYTFDFSKHKTPFFSMPWASMGDLGIILTLGSFIDSFANKHLPEVLPKALANRRQFNLFYQLGELKDLPQLIDGTRAFLDELTRFAKDPVTSLHLADKTLAGAYLTKIFGYDSLLQAAQQLIAYPTKLSKKLNYLLQKNGKTVPVRALRIYDGPQVLPFSVMADLVPSMIPVPYCETTNLRCYDLSKVEYRCSVNQRINFPKVGTPYGSAQTLSNSIGLTPRVVDLYNLIPWTWLIDWFTGLSSYLDMFEAVNGDWQLINAGFVHVLAHVEFALTGTVTIRNHRITLFSDGTESESFFDPVEVPVNFFYSGIADTRYNVVDLGAVKAVDLPDSLTDQQLSIITALRATHSV